MKRFRFSLESVLRLRGFRKRQASEELAQITQERLRIQMHWEEAKASLAGAEADFALATKSAVKASRLLFLQKNLASRRTEETDLGSQLSEAVKKEAKAREKLLKAQREEDAMLKLKQHQRERARREMEKEDEKAMQEFFTARQLLRKEG